MAQSAERVGADGILLFPPYLMTPSQEGLAAHVEAVCKAVKIGVVVYNRDNAILNEDTLARLCERNPSLVGFKDGVGDIELMTPRAPEAGRPPDLYRRPADGGDLRAALPDDGRHTYSSAIFNFMPEWALRFYDAVRARDHAAINAALTDFVMPYIAIRNAERGYAVSIVKAGLAAIGRPAGPVRSPLTDLKPAELGRLKELIDRAQAPLRKSPAMAANTA